jgi:predicted transcriptional regulator
VIRALKLINVYEVDDFVGSPKIADGIESLNILLDSFQSDGIAIPFRTNIVFDTSVGVKEYYFGYSPTLSLASTLTLTQVDYLQLAYNDEIIYDIPIANVNEEKKYTQLITDASIPYRAFFQRHNEYSQIEFYPAPDKSYQCTVTGKVALESLERNQPLTGLPPYAYKFLTYAVAKEPNRAFYYWTNPSAHSTLVFAPICTSWCLSCGANTSSPFLW